MIDPGAGGRRRARLAALVAGLGALVAGLGALAAGFVTLTGPGPAPADAGTLPANTVSAGPSVVPGPSPSTGPNDARRTAAPPTPRNDSFSPTRITIAALRVTAAVDAVSVARDGSLDIPENPDRLGWWIGSAMPGARRGTVVLAGHVDTAADGRGVLFGLERLPMGARIDVRAGDEVIHYRAVARRSYVKRRLPADLFRTDTAPRLVLITCGGTFVDGSYSHNVVVYAVPAG
jgi:hypothetical protein